MMNQQQNEKRTYVLEYVKREGARRNFWAFCKYYDQEFFDNRPFLKQIADAFQQIEDGTINSLSVSMPPRAGKSYITSLFCAWTLGKNPSDSVMRNTCTATLYAKFSYDVRAIVLSEKFKKIFTTRISPNKANLQGWNTTQSKQVGYFGAGVGGTIIGFGATKLAITDDLYVGIESAINETSNNKILQWKEATHDSRLEKNCSKIDIGTRWSVNDVIGKNVAEDRYDQSIIIPAIDQHGESFCSDVMTTLQYKDIRSRMTEHIWLAEYMQQPIDIEGRLFSEINYIDQEDYNRLLTQYEVQGAIAYIDVADQGVDYTAMCIATWVNDHVYISDYLMSKDNTDITLPLVASKLEMGNVKWCRVESNNMGAMYSRHLQKMTKTKILQVANTTNKITRIIMQAGFILNKFKFVKTNTNDYHKFMDNVLQFSKEGKNKNDDAPDCLAGLSIFTQSMFKNM